jgi:hypothetical protein
MIKQEVELYNARTNDALPADLIQLREPVGKVVGIAVQYFPRSGLLYTKEVSQDPGEILCLTMRHLMGTTHPHIMHRTPAEKISIVQSFFQGILDQAERDEFVDLRKLFQIPAKVEPDIFKLAQVRDLRGWRGWARKQDPETDPPFSLNWTNERLLDYLSAHWFGRWRPCTIIVGALAEDMSPINIAKEIRQRRMRRLNAKHISSQVALISHIGRRQRISSVVPKDMIPLLITCETATYNLAIRIRSRTAHRIVTDWYGLVSECNSYQEQTGRLSGVQLSAVIQEFTVAV